MKSLLRKNQADIIKYFNSFSRYLNDLHNINIVHFEQMGHSIYLAELQLNKADSSGTKPPFVDSNVSISNGRGTNLLWYWKWDDFDFDTLNFLFLDGDVPRQPLME